MSKLPDIEDYKGFVRKEMVEGSIPLHKHGEEDRCDCKTTITEKDFKKKFEIKGYQDPSWDFDQAAKSDAGKPRMSWMVWDILYDIVEVREYGNKKYGNPNNWKTVEPERYWDAMLRHLIAELMEPGSIDEESGISHWKHFCCNVAFLSYFKHQKEKEIKDETQ